MTEYRPENYFKAKPKKDFIYLFPLTDRKKQSNTEPSDSPFRKFISSFFFSPDHGNILSWANNE